MSEFKPILIPARIPTPQPGPIHVAAPVPCLVVEWPTGVYYGNHAICLCCCPPEAEGFVVPLPDWFRRRESNRSWRDLCSATEEEAIALVQETQEWWPNRIENLRFQTHPENRYCWHRCSFNLELWPASLAFDPVGNGEFVGWLAWPWEESSGYDPRPWGE